MPSAVWNFITTTLLSLACATTLYITYRRAIRPILSHYNIPLQSLPSFLTRRSRGWMDTRYHEVGSGEADTTSFLDGDDDDDEDGSPDLDRGNRGQQRREWGISRDLEEGFRDDSDDGGGDDKRGERMDSGVTGSGSLDVITPRPLEEDRSRFPATRI